MASLQIDSATVTVQGRQLVKDVSLTARGMTALVGPNGAGKSTLLKAISGIIPLSHGSIAFDGQDLLSLSRRDRASLVAFVEQSATTDERLSACDVASLGRIPFQSIWQSRGNADDDTIVARALEDVGLADLAERQFTSLSGGEQQRVLLARALAQQPRLLILDEPTSHLDVAAQMSVLDLLRHKAHGGLTVLLALHDLNLAMAYCDSVMVLHQGRVAAQGVPNNVLTPALLREVYGVWASVLHHPETGRPVIVYEPRNSN